MAENISLVPESEPKDSWRASSACSTLTCVQVLILPDKSEVRLRASHDVSGAVLTFTASEWRAFTTGVRNSEFDV
ncbi:DUF397 domain-containing protein [Kineosporia rhizophila]|uniref:DUF397 domain-containing protein n=1 Tax=Kineosporia rhizophila TaxID=84633 RepID=UPI000A924E52